VQVAKVPLPEMDVSVSDRDEREDYMVQQQAREVWIESYSQDRFLADCEGKEGRRVRQDNPNPTHPENLQTKPTAVPPERTPMSRKPIGCDFIVEASRPRKVRCSECGCEILPTQNALISKRGGVIKKRVCTEECRLEFDARFWGQVADDKEGKPRKLEVNHGRR
jgi:hypothetical protein